MTTIAIFGASGKMGTRISQKLRKEAGYRILHLESGEAGMARLKERGIKPTSEQEATSQADVVILAIPDFLIGNVASRIVPRLQSGAMVICLDPAAPCGGQLPDRMDISYFVTHPCHPPLINDESDPRARRDFFGGIARQNIVCALMQGPEEAYEKGERIARAMFTPVMNAHRITVEQMAILEPAMSETVVLTCMTVIREALEEAVNRGVPVAAARDFLFGHMNVDVGILFGFLDTQVSDGAKMAVKRAKQSIFQPDWKKVFEPDRVMGEVKAIISGITEK